MNVVFYVFQLINQKGIFHVCYVSTIILIRLNQRRIYPFSYSYKNRIFFTHFIKFNVDLKMKKSNFSNINANELI